MDTNPLPTVPRLVNIFKGPDAKVHLAARPGSAVLGCTGRTIDGIVLAAPDAEITCKGCLKSTTQQRVGSAFLTDEDRV